MRCESRQPDPAPRLSCDDDLALLQRDGVRRRVRLAQSCEHDAVVSPAAVAKEAHRFPTARLVELPGATHYAISERPDETAALVLAFLASVERPTSALEPR